MELVLKSADINLPHSIENLEALKAELIPRLEKYNNLVVTEDSIKAAKDDKAALNKLKKAIEEQRISIKKLYLEPYNVLEAQCKEVVKLIEEPIQAIDKQIKAFDDIEKKNKYEALTAAFDKMNTPNWLHINDVLNPKWENKTQKTDALITEMSEATEKLLGELASIEQMYANFPHLLAIIDKFKQCKDFSQAMVYAKQLEFQYQQEQKRKAEEDAQHKQAEEAKHAENNGNAPVNASTENSVTILPEVQNAGNVESERSEKILKGSFRVECEKSKLIALVAYMKEQGIKYEVIK